MQNAVRRGQIPTGPTNNIGVIYECLGKKEEALAYYRKCGGYAPAEERIRELGRR